MHQLNEIGRVVHGSASGRLPGNHPRALTRGHERYRNGHSQVLTLIALAMTARNHPDRWFAAGADQITRRPGIDFHVVAIALLPGLFQHAAAMEALVETAVQIIYEKIMDGWRQPVVGYGIEG